MRFSLLLLSLLSISIVQSQNDLNLYSWGRNANGQLGLNSTHDSISPKKINNDSTWTEITVGYNRTFAIKKNGSLWAWGNNTNGELGNGNTTNLNIPTQIGSDLDWYKINSGLNHVVAQKTDGTLWTWGLNVYGQLGTGDSTDYDVPNQMGSDDDWFRLAVGENFTIASKTDGTLWGWGSNNFGQLGLGDTLNRDIPTQIDPSGLDWAQIATGKEHVLGIRTDGALYAWGRNDSGQLGLGNLLDKDEPTKVNNWTNWLRMACGENHSIALRKDFTLWSWGDNTYGQLGQGDSLDRDEPTQVGLDSSWNKISAGFNHNLAINKKQRLFSWGINNYGQLGLGDTIGRSEPTQVGLDSNWNSLGSKSNHSIGLKPTIFQGKKICVNGKHPNHQNLTTNDTLFACISIPLKTKNSLRYTKRYWSTGDSSVGISVTQSGRYWVHEYTVGGCSSRDTVNIILVKDSVPKVKTTMACNLTTNQSALLNLHNVYGLDSNQYSFWDTASVPSKIKTVSAFSNAPFAYVNVLASDKRKESLKCRTTIKANLIRTPKTFVGKNSDTAVVYGSKRLIVAQNNKIFNKYLWSNGDTTNFTFNYSLSGKYWFRRYNNSGCTQTDTFTLSNLNLTVPSKRVVSFNKPIILRVKDSSNTNSFVVWSTGDTGWSTVYTPVSFSIDKIIATQYDAYGSYKDTTFLQIPTTPYEESTIVNATNLYTVYPNPSSNHIYILKSNGIETVETINLPYTIYNLMGIEVKRGLYNENINIEQLSDGLYFLHLENQKFPIIKH